MTDDELDLVESERLWDALGRRHDGILYVWNARQNTGGDGAMVGWRGGWIHALGMAQFAVAKLSHDNQNARTERDE